MKYNKIYGWKKKKKRVLDFNRATVYIEYDISIFFLINDMAKQFILIGNMKIAHLKNKIAQLLFRNVESELQGKCIMV